MSFKRATVSPRSFKISTTISAQNIKDFTLMKVISTKTLQIIIQVRTPMSSHCIPAKREWYNSKRPWESRDLARNSRIGLRKRVSPCQLAATQHHQSNKTLSIFTRSRELSPLRRSRSRWTSALVFNPRHRPSSLTMRLVARNIWRETWPNYLTQ